MSQQSNQGNFQRKRRRRRRNRNRNMSTSATEEKKSEDHTDKHNATYISRKSYSAEKYKSQYFDTHIHLDMLLQREYGIYSPFDQLEAFMNKHCPGNFGGCIAISCSIASIDSTCYLLDKAQELYDKKVVKYRIYGTFGMHPHNAKNWNTKIESKILDAIDTYRKKGLCVAVGECGLDFFIKRGNKALLSPKHVQTSVFLKQCQLASVLEMPLVVHSRDADKETFDVLCSVFSPKKANDSAVSEKVKSSHRIHIHCFTGGAEFVKNMLANFEYCYFGFTGRISFRNCRSHVAKIIKDIPLNRILLETDGPYMAPEPFRGKMAHPGHIPIVAHCIAEAHQVSVEEVLQQCRNNVLEMYGV